MITLFTALVALAVGLAVGTLWGRRRAIAHNDAVLDVLVADHRPRHRIEHIKEQTKPIGPDVIRRVIRRGDR